MLLVDDGSRDRSYGMMTSIHRLDPRFKVVHLSRNFGHQVAITAGMDLAEGDAVVVMDADLQDPPEVVLEMARLWHEGYEVVYGVRQDRTSDSRFKRKSASVFYRLLRRLTDVDIPADVGDFRLVDRRALDAFKEMEEGSRFVRGMFSWMGFRQIGVPYARGHRHAGETKYPLRKMLHLAAHEADIVLGPSCLAAVVSPAAGTPKAPQPQRWIRCRSRATPCGSPSSSQRAIAPRRWRPLSSGSARRMRPRSRPRPSPSRRPAR